MKGISFIETFMDTCIVEISRVLDYILFMLVFDVLKQFFKIHSAISFNEGPAGRI